MAQPFIIGVDLRIQRVLGLDAVKQQLAGIQIGGTAGLQQLSTGLKKVGVSSAITSISIAKNSNATTKLGKSARQTGKQLAGAARSSKDFGDSVAIAGKRYAAFLAATVGAFKAFQLISSGAKAVLDFDQSMVSLAQILDTSVDQLGNLSQEFLDLSVSTGTSASEIANAAKLLAQAGFRGNELSKSIEQLAKVPLTPIFENMEQAVDGAIAAMRQFSDEGLTVETVFDKMINVSNKYAASFPDIIEGLKRGGSAFEAIGGTLDEFIAAFTTIRSETRESASAVGTALKTLSSRLADPKIIQFLQTKNIRLLEDGQFVGPLEALRRIGNAMENIDAIQERINIATKLGGRRQISRFIALATNMDKTNEILEVSKDSFGTFNKVAEQGLESVSKQMDVIVNKAKKLAIELGEDLFIPFIKGLTGAADAAILVLDTLKPILPLVAKIGAAFAGIAAFRGVSGFIGSRVASLAGPAAFAGAGGGFAGAKAGLAASPFVQAGLLIAASELTASFLRTEDGADTFASTLVSSTALVAAAIALFRKQTIAQFAAGGGLLPNLGKGGKLGGLVGTLGTIGAIAAPLLIIEATRSANELSNKIVDSAVKSISIIIIDPIDAKSVKAGMSNLFTTIGQSVQALIDNADPRKDPSIKKFAAGVGRAFDNIFSGDFETLLRRGGLTKKNVDSNVQAILEKSPKLIDDLIESVANTVFVTGNPDNDPFLERQKLIEQGYESGLDFTASQEFSRAIIESVGGLDVWNSRVQKSVAILKQESEKREKIIRLTKAVVPTQLIGQLLKFSSAVDQTTRAINISAQLFETQIAEIQGGIQAPTLDIGFGQRQLERLIGGGNFDELFKSTPDIPKFIGVFSEIEDLLDSFILNISDLPSVDIDLPGEITKFFDLQQDVPQIIRNNFEKFFDTVATDIQNISKGQFIDADTIKARFKEQFAKLGTGTTDAVVTSVTNFMKATFTQIQDELNRLATVRKFELDAPITPKSQAAFLAQQLKRVGISAPGARAPTNVMRGTLEELDLIRRERARKSGRDISQQQLPTPPTGFFQGRDQRLVNIAGDERTRQRVRDSFQKFTIDLSNARKELSGLKPGAEDFVLASSKMKELARGVIELQTTMEALTRATQQALESEKRTLGLRQKFTLEQTRISLERRVQTGALEPIRAERILFDLQKEQLREQMALQTKFDTILEKDNTLRVNLAKEISSAQSETTNDFDTSVNIFTDATKLQVTAAELMNQYVNDFGQAVVDFRSFRGVDRLTDGNKIVTTTPDQIQSNDTSSRQAFDEYISLLGDNNNSQKDIVEILGAIFDLREQTFSTQQQSTDIQKEQVKDTATSEQISKLTDSLDGLRTVINEPSEIKLVTDQRIDIDLSTLPLDISAEIRPLLEEVAIVVAKTVTRKALESLAAKSGSEVAIAATDTAQELS